MSSSPTPTPDNENRDAEPTTTCPTCGAPIIEWFLATCLDCQPTLPQPFRDEGQRDAWRTAHQAGTGHTVAVYEEVRRG